MSSVSIPTAQNIWNFGRASSAPLEIGTLAPMQNTVVRGSLYEARGTWTSPYAPPIPYMSTVKVWLQQGELFTASVDVQAKVQTLPNNPWFLMSYSGQASSLSVWGPSTGTGSTGPYPLVPAPVAVQSASPAAPVVDPVTGQRTMDSSVIFRAGTTGLYTVLVTTDPDAQQIPPNKPLMAIHYTLEMRPIGLVDHTVAPAASAADASLASYAGGGLYAWLNDSHTALTFSGPTGIGFQVNGTWTQTKAGTASWSTTTYSAKGAVSVKFGNASIPLYLPPGASFVVQTQPNGYDGWFGQVTDARFQVLSKTLTSVAGPLKDLANWPSLAFAGAGSTMPSLDAGIGLGGDVGVKSTGLAAGSAVPYLYLTGSTILSFSYGNVTVTAGPTYRIGMAINPADPSIGLYVRGVPIVNEFALEVSQNATLPFTPWSPPDLWSGTLYGNVYLKGGVDIATLTGGSLPLYAASEIVANIDPQHVGLTSALAGNFRKLINGKMAVPEALAYLGNMSLGINGEVDLALSAGPFGFTIPAFTGTVIFDGPGQTSYIHAGSVNLFANTPLASFLPSAGVSFDGMIRTNGQFQFTAQQSIAFAGLAATARATLSNSGLVLEFQARTTPSISLGPVSASVVADYAITLSIQFSSSGDLIYSLDGSVSFSASCKGKKLGLRKESFSWSGSGKLEQMKKELGQIFSNVANDIEKAIKKWWSDLGNQISNPF